MSSTDELRTWAAERVPIVRKQIEKIADNIDAEFVRVAKAADDALGRSEESYDAGFKNGMKATLQQLYGLLHDYPTLDDIEAWADRQWEEEL